MQTNYVMEMDNIQYTFTYKIGEGLYLPHGMTLNVSTIDIIQLLLRKMLLSKEI